MRMLTTEYLNVFGHLLERHKKFKNQTLDYSEYIYNKSAKTGGGGHPLINTVLGKWIDHMKGDRKFSGKSKKSDLLFKRNEGYWQ